MTDDVLFGVMASALAFASTALIFGEPPDIASFLLVAAWALTFMGGRFIARHYQEKRRREAWRAKLRTRAP